MELARSLELRSGAHLAPALPVEQRHRKSSTPSGETASSSTFFDLGDLQSEIHETEVTAMVHFAV
jgi:hypothetical protein